ncbi:MULTISPECIES: hypothetical protein [Phaeobacter]|uniref:Uncharacterized protein n=1 Tax=Phaeobacter porticola TaxID=1844006 RepID=A0A1L3I0N7_9RHOB|nr:MULTISPECIES: hypothetical protein [Phaeobacter]APG45692.1 hypothetical protein PhaeoP97_00240 [Phaeobacter porticola]AUR38352.1 hypothetical protein PhaeoP18_04136 [Phaeobacter piscinae]AXT33799.1 hypothetical protein D1820_01785 [Phaeobacter sp. LSS9]
MTTKIAETLSTARATITADPRFAGFRQFGIWDKRITEDSLPAFGVGVPRWTDDDKDTLTSGEAVTTVVIALKRSDGDLESLAFEDAAAIKALLLSALEDEAHELSFQEATYQEDTAGEKPVSTLSMMFSFTYWPAVL